MPNASNHVFADTFSRIAAVLGSVGIVLAVATNVIGVLVHSETGFVADTISDLGAGRYAWIQDIGLCAFAIGLLAVAVALLRGRLSGWDWWLGGSVLAAVAIAVFLIGIYNEYGDGDEGGLVIHIYLVAFLGIGFALAALALMRGLKRLDAFWARLSGWLAVVWILAAPVFFFVPTNWDGLYERGVAAILLLWVAAICRLLWSGERVSPSNQHRL